MSILTLVDSYAAASTERLHELREAIDHVIHRRANGLAPCPSDIHYFDLNGEKACAIPGFSNYAITEAGRVYSYFSNKYVLSHQGPKNGVRVILRTPLGKRGKRAIMVHKLVALYFLHKPSGCDMIQHVDGNKLNNHILNLKWISRSHNQGRRGVQATSKTGYKGVTILPNGKYKVTIQGRHICCCDTAEEAAHIYNQRAKDIGFEFLNQITKVA
jgi:hypothetical protein